jgi:outer membrane lipoprotein carrier protein
MKTGTRHSILVLVAFFCLVTAPVFALPDVNTVARLVDDRYNHLASLEADFTEIYQGSGTERTESGKLWLKKPSKMRWEYRSPEEKLFVADGHDGWLYLPQEKQVRKSSMKDLNDLRSPIAFLLGKTKLERELSGLSFAPEFKLWHPEDAVVRGVPKGMEDQIRDVALEITPEHQIARILIYGVDDSVTEYRFANLKENVRVPESLFRFRPVEGTEVIENDTGN